MKSRSILVCGAGLPLLAASLAQRPQDVAPPEAYSLTVIDSTSGAPVVERVYRDTFLVVVDRFDSADATAPKSPHLRTLYNLEEHTSSSWHEPQQGEVCVHRSFAGDWGDPFLIFSRITDDGSRSVSQETIHGMQATVYNTPRGANAAIKAWIQDDTGLVFKEQWTLASGEPKTVLEVTEANFTPPATSTFTLPWDCAHGAEENTVKATGLNSVIVTASAAPVVYIGFGNAPAGASLPSQQSEPNPLWSPSDSKPGSAFAPVDAERLPLPPPAYASAATSEAITAKPEQAPVVYVGYATPPAGVSLPPQQSEPTPVWSAADSKQGSALAPVQASAPAVPPPAYAAASTAAAPIPARPSAPVAYNGEANPLAGTPLPPPASEATPVWSAADSKQGSALAPVQASAPAVPPPIYSSATTGTAMAPAPQTPTPTVATGAAAAAIAAAPVAESLSGASASAEPLHAAVSVPSNPGLTASANPVTSVSSALPGSAPSAPAAASPAGSVQASPMAALSTPATPSFSSVDASSGEDASVAAWTAGHAQDYTKATRDPGSHGECSVLLRVVKAGTLEPITSGVQAAIGTEAGIASLRWSASASDPTADTRGLYEVLPSGRDGIFRIENAPSRFTLETYFGIAGALRSTVYLQCFAQETTLLLVVKNPSRIADGAQLLWVKSSEVASK